jgi:hypothetical protein
MTLANKHTITTTSNRTATPLSKYIVFEPAAKAMDSGVLVKAPEQIDISRSLAGAGKG